ncbi:MAG: hypothetical protein DRJ68_03095 [Thermoprotei archaeon]|nr:MAG: hypothetical protein DRJ68_03095 [Thermoprotei archaeon]
MKVTLRRIWIYLMLLFSMLCLTVSIVHAQEDVVNNTDTNIFNKYINGFKSAIDDFLSSIQEALIYVINKGLIFLVTVIRASYVALALLGVVLWASGFSPYRGRSLILGAIILAVVSEVAYGMLSP